jgi:hypothetical protein
MNSGTIGLLIKAVDQSSAWMRSSALERRRKAAPDLAVAPQLRRIADVARISGTPQNPNKVFGNAEAFCEFFIFL